MDKDELSRIADLVTQDDRPGASLLTPEVRSGSSFTYTPVVGAALMPAFLLVWFYTVDDPKAFVLALKNSETAGINPPAGVEYRGTYSVSISSASPDLEFRTYWGLNDLGKLQALNDFLPTAGAAFHDMLKLIARPPVMRSELMGLTRSSTPIQSPPPIIG